MRVPRAGDGVALNEAIARLARRARSRGCRGRGTLPTVDESERIAGAAGALPRCARTCPAASSCATATAARASFVGGTGLHRIDWSVRGSRSATGAGPAARDAASSPRRCGRWRGSPSTRSRAPASRCACDDQQRAQLAVAERAASRSKALLRLDSLTPTGEPRTRAVYARVRGAEEPMGPARVISAASRRLVGERCAGREAIDGVGDDAVDAERDRAGAPRPGRSRCRRSRAGRRAWICAEQRRVDQRVVA